MAGLSKIPEMSSRCSQYSEGFGGRENVEGEQRAAVGRRGKASSRASDVALVGCGRMFRWKYRRLQGLCSSVFGCWPSIIRAAGVGE